MAFSSEGATKLGSRCLRVSNSIRRVRSIKGNVAVESIPRGPNAIIVSRQTKEFKESKHARVGYKSSVQYVVSFQCCWTSFRVSTMIGSTCIAVRVERWAKTLLTYPTRHPHVNITHLSRLEAVRCFPIERNVTSAKRMTLMLSAIILGTHVA